MKKLKYSSEQIRQALACLNSFQLSGIDNAKMVCLIENILQNPIEEEKENGDRECS